LAARAPRRAHRSHVGAPRGLGGTRSPDSKCQGPPVIGPAEVFSVRDLRTAVCLPERRRARETLLNLAAVLSKPLASIWATAGVSAREPAMVPKTVRIPRTVKWPRKTVPRQGLGRNDLDPPRRGARAGYSTRRA